MNAEVNNKIVLYTSSWCGHSRIVERLLESNNVPVTKINIDGDRKARQVLIELNNGYASVPTLLFPDGSKLTEPSTAEVRSRLNLPPTQGIGYKIRSMLGLSKPDPE